MEVGNEILQQILTEIRDMKSDMGDMKSDIINIKSDIFNMKSDMGDMKSSINRNGVLLEALDKKVQLIYENQIEVIDQTKRIVTLEDRVDNLETEMFGAKEAIREIKTKGA